MMWEERYVEVAVVRAAPNRQVDGVVLLPFGEYLDEPVMERKRDLDTIQ